MLIADVAAHRETQSARGCRAVVADDVAGQVRRNYDVIPFRIANLPLTERIDVSVIKCDVRKLALANFAEDFAKKAMRADDVRLFDAGNFLLFVSPARQIESVAHDAFSSAACYANRRDAATVDVACLARVRIFGVLANDDVINFARFPNLFQLAVNLVL